MPFDVHPLDPLGAEIRGLTLRGDLPDRDFEALRQAILEHGLVVLRDQSLPDDEQIALGRRFGPLEVLATAPDQPISEMVVLANVDPGGEVIRDEDQTLRAMAINEQWHTDSSFRETPATYSLFKAVVVPPEGVETWYASLRSGYEALDPKTRELIEGRRARHDYVEAYRIAGATSISDGLGHKIECWQPLVRRHPETGARGLYVTGHAFDVEGMETSEGRALVGKLLAVCTGEGRVYRHRWRSGDVLIWDNRCMLHRAQGFDQRHARVMHHVRVAGTEPVVS